MRPPWIVGALIALMVATPVAFSQTTTRLRGTIVAIDGKVMAVKSLDGRDIRIDLADSLTVAVAKASTFENIKVGDYVGATTARRPDGSNAALEVHYIATTVPEGQNPSELQPGATMTNATVASLVSATGARELTLQFKGGSHRVLVPENTPIVRTVPGTRADLVPGEYVFVAVQVAPDGALTAARIQVSKDGVKPPQ
jgi:hypothetical protein